MLDPRLLRERPGEVSEMLRARGVRFDLDALVESDRARRVLIQETDALRTERNRASLDVAAAKKGGADPGPLIARVKEASERLEALEGRRAEAEKKYASLASAMPNMLDPSVPVGGESASRVERSWGQAPSCGQSHVDFMERTGLADTARAAKVSGARFYYLRGGLVRLNMALACYALDFLAERGYTQVQPPYMIGRSAMEGAVIAEDFEDVIYKVEGHDLFLIGTSEHAMAAMHSGEILEGAKLPLRYAGVSPCFRKEAGAHGRDQKGIFRVHQFDKVEQFVFARPEDSAAEHRRMLGISEEFYRSLGIPHRVVLLASGDMGKVSSKTWDIEAWMAGQQSYREVVSCSNCLDYQARRLGVRFRDRTSDPTAHVHTLNSTLVATTRVMACMMESSGGSISVPRALQKYVGSEQIG